MSTPGIDIGRHSGRDRGDRLSGKGTGLLRALLCSTAIVFCLLPWGCAEITQPTPSRSEVEAVQLTALTRHPHTTYTHERAMRVFLRLLPTLPRIHGRTYPFLGFNWWVTATGQPVVDNVWQPSPAHDRPLRKQVATLFDPNDDRPPPPDLEAGLKPGDVILSINGLSLPTWMKEWNELVRGLRDIFQYSFPAEVLADFVLTAQAARQEMTSRYRGGPVTLLIDRQGVKRQVTLYPMHLPAEYGLLLATGRAGESITALAAPGQVLITRAMLDFCRTDDELAIILGHELAHHAHGHLVRRTVHYPLTGLVPEVIALPFRLIPWLATASPSRVSDDIRRVSRNAAVSVYSRQEELEADAYGLWYAYQAGYEVDRGIFVWERMSAARQGNLFENTYFLDSHPAAAERLARLQKMAQLFKTGQAARVLAP